MRIFSLFFPSHLTVSVLKDIIQHHLLSTCHSYAIISQLICLLIVCLDKLWFQGAPGNVQLYNQYSITFLKSNTQNHIYLEGTM